MKRIEKSEAAWRERLSDQAYRVCREKGTERAFSGDYWETKAPGDYVCVCCETRLFSSTDKFDSGTGWPSFTKPVDAAHVATETDGALFMTRTEVLCAACDAHLGHVFDDGPAPENKRYFINSISLKLVPSK